MQRIMTCLCFSDQAEEAVGFYASVFKDLKVTAKTHCGAGEHGGKPGSVRTISFNLFGQEFMAVNGGEHFRFSDAMSLQVWCDTQSELDRVWEALSHGGEQVQCGWLQDRFGVSWQVLPRALDRMMRDPDETRSQAVVQAVMKMVKIDIAQLERAYAGREAA